jgi:hypothetical protein
VKCFAGNRDLPLLHLFLIASLILPGEILLPYCLYFSTILVYLPVVYGCPPLHEEPKAIEAESYLFKVYTMAMNITVITALLSTPRWLTVCVQVLSREHWNEVLLNLQACGPGQARINTIKSQ